MYIVSVYYPLYHITFMYIVSVYYPMYNVSFLLKQQNTRGPFYQHGLTYLP